VAGWVSGVVPLFQLAATQTRGTAHGDTFPAFPAFSAFSTFPVLPGALGFCASVCLVPGRMYYPNELSSVYTERLQFRLLAFTFLSDFLLFVLSF